MSLLSELRRRNVIKAGTAYSIAAWVVIEVASVILPVFETPGWVMRALVVAAALGLPIVLLFSWAFEITPQGIVRSEALENDSSVYRSAGRRLNFLIIGLLVVAVAVLATTHGGFGDRARTTSTPLVPGAQPEHSSPVPDRTVAVLPFENLDPETDQGFFSEGLSEELLTLLAKVSEIRVAGRRSAFAFQYQDADLATIAARLKVANLLVGTVRRSGDRLRITARLIDARNGYVRWSETYDRRLDDIFAVQEDIAAAVVEQLRGALLADAPQAEHTDPQAYALFLQARYLARRFTADSMAQAVDLYRQALAIDPGYLPAYSQLAVVYMNQASFGIRPLEEGYELAREAAETALAIDPAYGPGYGVLGWIAMNFEGDLAAAAWYYQKALALAPADDTVVANAAVLAVALGRLDEAIRLLSYAIARDPVDPVSYANLASAYYLAGRSEEAAHAVSRVLSLSSRYQGAHYRRSLIYLQQDRADEALAEAQMESLESARLLGTALAYAAVGRRAESDTALQSLKEQFGDAGAGNYAQVHAFRGEIDEAFHWLEVELEESGSGAFKEYQHDPLLVSLHPDPRWYPLLERAGYDSSKLEAIDFDVELPDWQDVPAQPATGGAGIERQ